MKHWYVPGVTTAAPLTLPRMKNLSRETEHVYGTSRRDPIAFAYQTIKGLIDSPEELQLYLNDHIFRLIFLRLDKSSIPRYEKLSHNERLDLALTEGILDDSLRSLVFQIQTERSSKVLLSVFLNFLKNFQSEPLEFQPLFSQLISDKEIFEEDEEAINSNNLIIRVL
jgi:hypothetical protein